jgi:hypothetical protein
MRSQNSCSSSAARRMAPMARDGPASMERAGAVDSTSTKALSRRRASSGCTRTWDRAPPAPASPSAPDPARPRPAVPASSAARREALPRPCGV